MPGWRGFASTVECGKDLLAAFAIACLTFCCLSCGGGSGGSGDTAPLPDEVDAQPLHADEVRAIMERTTAAIADPIAVAVSDRRGVLLGVATNFGMDAATFQSHCVAAPTCPLIDTTDADCGVVELAVQLARTAAFFSADQTPLTSRSIRFLSGEHFPPHIANSAAAALFGIENTNRGCNFDANSTPEPLADTVPRPRSLAGEMKGAPCDSLPGDNPNVPNLRRCGCSRGIATLPGGVPIFRNGRMSGGIGVAIRGVTLTPDPVAAFESAVQGEPDVVLRRNDDNAAFERAELAARAFAGDAVGFPTLRRYGLPNLCSTPNAPACCNSATPCFLGILPAPAGQLGFDPVIFVDGIEIPEVKLNPTVDALHNGAALAQPFIVDPESNPSADPIGRPVHSGWLLAARDATVTPAAAAALSAAETTGIINAGIAEARRIRAAIRLPLATRSSMVLAVSDTAGNLLGVFRMDDATVFSIDVAIAKSRNVVYFSGSAIARRDTLDCPAVDNCGAPFFSLHCDTPEGCTAMTNRTIGFAAQPFFPSGIEGNLSGFPAPFTPGPLRRVFLDDSALPCSNGLQPEDGRQNGIVFFPGSAPLYRNGVLVGGLGVSGDGVEQDDLVTFAGTRALSAFEAPAARRADQLSVRGVRLPYFKFNRQPYN